jgi:hypothetical protein
MLHKMLEWEKEVLTPEDLNNFLLAKDGTGRTVWHVAAEIYTLCILQKMWEWSKEVLTTEDIKMS